MFVMQRQGERGRAFTAADGLALAGFALVAAALAYPHMPVLRLLSPPCVFLHLTGLPCGTCGFTRAFVRGGQGDWLGALSVSPFGALLFYAWGLTAIWVAASWLAPSLPRPPGIRPTTAPQRSLVRFGVPIAFLLNWVYLIAFTLVEGAPPA